MKIHSQHHPDLATVGRLIEPFSVAMLTTLSDDDALVSQPMAALEMDEDGAVWFLTDLRSELGEHLRSANLCFSDEGHSTFVSLSGRGEVVIGRERVERLWTPFAAPWFPDGPDSRHLALLKFVPNTAAYWDAPNSRMVRMLALAASALVGRPVGVGEHDVLDPLPTDNLETRLPEPRGGAVPATP